MGRRRHLTQPTKGDALAPVESVIRSAGALAAQRRHQERPWRPQPSNRAGRRATRRVITCLLSPARLHRRGLGPPGQPGPGGKARGEQLRAGVVAERVLTDERGAETVTRALAVRPMSGRCSPWLFNSALGRQGRVAFPAACEGPDFYKRPRSPHAAGRRYVRPATWTGGCRTGRPKHGVPVRQRGGAAARSFAVPRCAARGRARTARSAYGPGPGAGPGPPTPHPSERARPRRRCGRNAQDAPGTTASRPRAATSCALPSARR
jgi:hypothetical protein